MSVSRRYFLQSFTIGALGSVMLPYSRAEYNVVPYAAQSHAKPYSKVVIFQDKAIFDENGTLEAYVPPSKPAESTRKYVNSLDEQTFLSRHWFI